MYTIDCDICHNPCKNVYYDAKTRMGPWATLCKKCFDKYGVGLGTGRGQKFDAVTGKQLKFRKNSDK